MSVSELFSVIPQTIGQWGPAGIVAVLIIVAERKLKARWENTDGKDHDYMTLLYVGNWIFIGLLLLLTTFLYVTKDNGIKVAMKGTIQNIPEQVSIFSNADFYQRRVPRRFSNKTNILWHFTDNTKENSTFLLVQKERDLDPTEYFIDPNGDYADSANIVLRYKEESLEYRNTKNRWIRLVSVDEPLRQDDDLLDDMEEDEDSFVDILINTLMTPAYAEDLITFDNINTGLQSQNPYTRRDAASYLYDNYQTYLPIMDKILYDKATNDKQLWAVLTVLTKLSAKTSSTQEKTWQLSPQAEKAIFETAFNKKASLAKQARRYLVRNITDTLLMDYEKACTQLEKQETLQQQRCASLGVTLYYQNALNVTKNTTATENIEYALEQMKSKTDLWHFAPKKVQIHYAKLFYGIGRISEKLALHYEQQNNTALAMKARQESVTSFNTFLSFIEEHSSETKSYRSKKQIQQAACYINTPNVACFTKTYEEK